MYGQLAVFWASLQQPFNDWSQKHVNQGFAWRQGSASFRTLEESGEHAVKVEVFDLPTAVSDNAVRVVEVPFEVPADGKIEVASIGDSFQLTLPVGLYSLRCEFFPKSHNKCLPVKLVFSRSDSPVFKIIRADAELVIEGPLLTEAIPAQ
jgi:hypothetical protein